MSKKTVLIVGGAGFIGSHVNLALNQAGYETIVYDNLSSGKKEAVISGELIVGDMGDEAALDALFRSRRIDAVMHFAGSIDVGGSVKDPARHYINNVAKTLILLNTMRRFNIQTLIFSSTAAIYGVPQDDFIKEEHPKNPINPYGRSKLMIEMILSDFSLAYGLKYTSLRYFNAAGGDPMGILKNHKDREDNLIPIILRNILEGNDKVTIFGTDYPSRDGTCLRDYIHVMDLANAHIKALEKLFKERKSKAYNLGVGRGITVKEVVDAVQTEIGREVTTLNGERRVGDPFRLVADGSLAAEELEWSPKYTLKEIIHDAWKALK
ncbi:MAG: UDP-glucose 4-epimerase GalE [Waddliaceae bacterium]